MSEQKWERRYTLQEATKVFYSGKISKRTLRNEFKRHKVPLERLGNKDFCTAADIDALRKAIRGKEESCHAENCLPALSYENPDVADGPTGPSSTERKRAALAAARMTLRELRQNSKSTSAPSTDRPLANVVQLISSSTK
jgi:hypothetical protein